MCINCGQKLLVQMWFLKFTLILRGEVWGQVRGGNWKLRAGNWDQGSSCPFCGLAFHLGCATRCRQHFRAHIFLFTLLWSCLLGHVPCAVHFTAVGWAYVAKADTDTDTHLGFLFMGSLGIFLVSSSSHLQFCSLHLLKRQKVKLV